MTLLDRLIALGAERGIWSAEESPLRQLTEVKDSLDAIETAVLERDLLTNERWTELRSAVESDAATTLREAPGALGRYRLLERIGAGGGGEVYRAMDSQLRRIVAVKRIRREDQERFLREAQATAKLQHPHIVPVFDMGKEGDWCYLVLQFIEGRNLKSWRSAAKPDWKAIARALEQTAQAIAYAHAQHILHRDLKPENILVDAEGKAFVTDFGLARETDRGARLTVQGMVLGTPCYMSPEQAEGDLVRVDETSDVYSLGATLYCLLTESEPFEAPTLAQLLRKVRLFDPIVPRALDPSVPRDLETICLKAMAKEKERRYPTAAEFADDLKRFRDGEPIRARPTGPLLRLFLRAKRRPLTALLVAATLLLVVAGSAVALHFAEKAGSAEQRAREKEEEEERTRRRARVADHLNAARVHLESASTKWYREGAHAEVGPLADRAVAEGKSALEIDSASADAHLVIARALAVKASSRRDAEIAKLADEHFTQAARLADRVDVHLSWARSLLDRYAAFHAQLTPYFDGHIRLKIVVAPGAADLVARATAALARVQSDGSAPEKTWSAAMTFLLRQEYEAGLPHFRAMEAEIRTDVMSLDLYSICLVGAGRIDEAEKTATTAIRTSGFHANLFLTRALERVALNRREEAERDFQEAIQLDPKNADHRVWRGLVRTFHQEFDGALEDFKIATELAPQNYSAWAGRGYGEMALSRYPDAIESFSKSLKIEAGSENSSAWRYRGHCRYALRQYREALQDWERATTLDPRFEPEIRPYREDARRRVDE